MFINAVAWSSHASVPSNAVAGTRPRTSYEYPVLQAACSALRISKKTYPSDGNDFVITARASIYRQRIQSPYGAAYISPVHRPAPVSPPEPAFTVREFGLPYGSAQLPFLRPSQHYCQRIESPAHTQYTYNAIQRDTHTQHVQLTLTARWKQYNTRRNTRKCLVIGPPFIGFGSARSNLSSITTPSTIAITSYSLHSLLLLSSSP